MLIKNNKYNTFPLIAHNPYIEIDSLLWDELIKKNLKKCQKPHDLTIVTWNNQETKGMLQIQLESLNIDYICLGKGIKWETNRNKPKLLLEYIKNIKTNYILGLDCYDVIIIGNIFNIIEKFKKFKCKLLFNSTGTVFPPDEGCEFIEKSRCEGPFCFFNSGAFLGETDFIESVFSNLNLSDPSWPFSDQFILRKKYYSLFPQIKIDSMCEIFQTMNLFKNKNNNFDLEKYLKLSDILFI
jgi:hypothetical protein